MTSTERMIEEPNACVMDIYAPPLSYIYCIIPRQFVLCQNSGMHSSLYDSAYLKALTQVSTTCVSL